MSSNLTDVLPEEAVFPPALSPVPPDAPENLPGGAQKKKIRLPDLPWGKYLRTGGKTLLISGMVLSVVSIMLLLSKLHTLTIRVNSIEAAFRSGQIGQLSSSVASLDSRLLALEKQSVTQSGLRKTAEELSSRVSLLESGTEKLSTTVSKTQQAVDDQDPRIRSLENNFSHALLRLDNLEKFRQQERPVSTPDTHTKNSKNPARGGASGHSVKKPERSVRRSAHLVAPFILTGIEHRGGQTYAVVIPQGGASVAQIQLLAPGDGSLGWVLRETRGNEAIFSVNGQEQALTVR